MNLARVQEAWDHLGQKAPLRSMLSTSVYGKISTMEEYFAFGRNQTDQMMTYLSSLGLMFKRHKAVDFGCGLGRSTQAMAAYFDEVCGVDIAPSILQLARSHNQHPDKCTYLINNSNDLTMFENESVDFICSFGTLQHVNAQMFEQYTREFMRILVPGGVLIFNNTSVPKKTGRGWLLRVLPTNLINLYRRKKYGRETYAIPQRKVIKMIERAGGTVVDWREDHINKVSDHWVSVQYCVSK